MPEELHHLAAESARAGVSFAKVKSLEAQVLLYRGFLHEVNNSLAGIGSLAEVLKDSEGGPALSKNMELIIHAAYKSCDLQRKIRNLYAQHEEWIDIDLSAFLQDHKPLLELILHGEARVAAVLTNPGILRGKIDLLWNILSVGAIWAKEKQATQIEYTVFGGAKLRITLPNKAVEAGDLSWDAAFCELGCAANADVETRGNSVVFSF
jgi:hypothetical protein